MSIHQDEQRSVDDIKLNETCEKRANSIESFILSSLCQKEPLSSSFSSISWSNWLQFANRSYVIPSLYQYHNWLVADGAMLVQIKLLLSIC